MAGWATSRMLTPAIIGELRQSDDKEIISAIAFINYYYLL